MSTNLKHEPAERPTTIEQWAAFYAKHPEALQAYVNYVDKTIASQAERITELETMLKRTHAELQHVATTGDPNVTLGVLMDGRIVLAKAETK